MSFISFFTLQSREMKHAVCLFYAFILLAQRVDGSLPILPLSLRGGSFLAAGDSPVELNPDYVPPPRSNRPVVRLEDIPEYPRDFYIETQTYSFDGSPTGAGASLADKIRQYVMHLHQISPALCMTAMACLGIFILWQIPAFQPTLQRHFVVSRHNVKARGWSTLLLSSISHVGLLHLAVNMMALLSMGPRVAQTLQRSSRWPLWPLLLGAAMSGSISFLLFDRKHSGCMGLSAVTLSLLAVYARFFPNHSLGILLAGVIPVRMQASQLLRFLLVWSGFASLAKTRSRVAHSAHFGGLLFGTAYYEVWLRRRDLRSALHIIKSTCKLGRK